MQRERRERDGCGAHVGGSFRGSEGILPPGLDFHPDRDMADSTFRSGRDCEEEDG